MVLANETIMGKLKIRYYIRSLIVIIFVFFLYGCNNNRLSNKEYNCILDSLKQIEVPIVFDTIKFFNQGGAYQDIDSMTPEGIIIKQSSDENRNFRQRVKHQDSLFWNVFEYDAHGFLKCYYRQYLYRCSDYPTGYVVYYKQGEVESFSDLWYGLETGFNAKYSIYDIIDKLRNDGIDLHKHKVRICYTDLKQRKDEHFGRHDKYYWIVGINYYHDYEAEYKEIKYQHKLRISPDTGEVLEDWMEQWE